MNSALPIARPVDEGRAGTPASALAAIATIRSPVSIARRDRSRRRPAEGGRSGDRPGPPTESPEQPEHGRPRHGPEQAVLDEATDDAGEDDARARASRVELAATRRDARADDDEVARHGDRQAGLLHQDQAGDGQDRRELGRHPVLERQGSSRRRRRVMPAMISNADGEREQPEAEAERAQPTRRTTAA